MISPRVCRAEHLLIEIRRLIPGTRFRLRPDPADRDVVGVAPKRPLVSRPVTSVQGGNRAMTFHPKADVSFPAHNGYAEITKRLRKASGAWPCKLIIRYDQRGLPLI
jgi:hypothetical protein